MAAGRKSSILKKIKNEKIKNKVKLKIKNVTSNGKHIFVAIEKLAKS